MSIQTDTVGRNVLVIAFICCRNDAIGSAGIILAGLLVIFTGSFWPDIIIGSAIATIVCLGCIKIIRLSLKPISSVEDDCCDTES